MRLKVCFGVAVLGVASYVVLLAALNDAKIEKFYKFWRKELLHPERFFLTPLSRSDSKLSVEKQGNEKGHLLPLQGNHENGKHLLPFTRSDVSPPAPTTGEGYPAQDTAKQAVSTVPLTREWRSEAVSRGAVPSGGDSEGSQANREVRGWQSVTTNSSLQLYSAFYDDVTGQTLRLLALGRQEEFQRPQPVWCHVWEQRNSPRPWLARGTAQIIEWKPHSNCGVFVLCNLTSLSRPYAVSITMGKGDNIANWIPVKYPRGSRLLSVCFPALNAGYSNGAEMVQTIELDRILGTEKFYIYEFNSRPQIKAILTYYQKKGVLEVLPWRFSVNGSIHYFGQNIAANDCVYRNLHESQFVALKDLDEVIVPRNYSTLRDVLKNITARKNFAGVGSIIARNAFFWKSHADDIKGAVRGEQALRLGIQSLTKLWRQKTIDAVGRRSKQFVLPDRVLHVGVHVTKAHRPGYHAIALDPSEGASHHYHRAWSPDLLRPENLVRDDVVRRKYGQKLLAAVNRVYEEMKMDCKCEKPW